MNYVLLFRDEPYLTFGDPMAALGALRELAEVKGSHRCCLQVESADHQTDQTGEWTREQAECKHLDLIVQRNQGQRWVTCTDCHGDFLPEYVVETWKRRTKGEQRRVAELEAENEQLREGIRQHRDRIVPSSFGLDQAAADDDLWALLEHQRVPAMEGDR